MAETTQKTIPTPVKTIDEKPPLTREQVTKKIEIIEESLKTFVGKVGFNPFLWAEKNLRPLKDKFIKGDNSPELFLSIINLPDNPSPDTSKEVFKPGMSSVILDEKIQG